MEASRRDFLKKSGLLAAGGILAASLDNSLLAQALALPGTFELPVLPYAYDALEPHIDKQTMEIHHSRHHKAYVSNLNAAILEHKIEEPSVEKICENISKYPVSVRNNGGGHYNHSLYWMLMKPNAGGQPGGKLASAIQSAFGSFDKFKNKFTDADKSVFGYGWAWLIVANGKL